MQHCLADVLPTIPTKIPDSIKIMIIVIMLGSLIPIPNNFQLIIQFKLAVLYTGNK